MQLRIIKIPLKSYFLTQNSLISFKNTLVPNIKFIPNSLYSTSNQTFSKTYPPNSSLEIGSIYNRNPRNLEKLRITPRPSGWYIDKPGKCYLNKLVLTVSSKNIAAKIVHFHGYTPVQASTNEWCIRKFIYSAIDSTAVETVASVLAKRCLESGILELYCSFSEEERSKPKVSLFLTTLEKSGLNLNEPKDIQRTDFISDIYLPEKPWEIIEDVKTGEVRRERISYPSIEKLI